MVDEDIENYSAIRNNKLLIIVGHSEYWTRKARENIDKFVANGGNLLILSGNVMWWHVRYNNSKNKMICYRYSDIDPDTIMKNKTVQWNDSVLKYNIFKSIGADFSLGGYGNTDKDMGWDGYKVIKPNSPIFRNTEIKKDSVIALYTEEYDGAPLLGFNNLNEPILDSNKLNFYKAEIIAFDLGFRLKPTVGTFIVFQKTPNSGIVINTASTNWCSKTGIGGRDSIIIRKITQNMIDILLEPNSNVFSDN